MSKRIYIAGPMTGLPEYNYPAFFAAEATLKALGYTVENPARNPTPACGKWEAYMRQALRQMLVCDEIALLPGWQESKGANIEFQLAKKLGMPIAEIRS